MKVYGVYATYNGGEEGEGRCRIFTFLFEQDEVEQDSIHVQVEERAGREG